MNFRQIEAFRSVMIAGSVSGAGRLMCISQPAVSRLIKDLECQIGFELFERKHNRLHPTPEARLLAVEVKRSFDGMDRIERIANSILNRSFGQLSIIAAPMMAYEVLPEIIGQFHKAHPGIFVELKLGTREDIEDLVSNHISDLGVEAPPFNKPGLTEKLLSKEPAICVLPRDHALSRKKIITPEDLEGEDFISLPPDTPLRGEFDAVFKKAGVERNHVAETHTQQSACNLVKYGVGITLAGPLAIRDISMQNLVTRPFIPNVEVRYSLVHSSIRPLSNVTQLFIDQAQQYFALSG